MEAIIGEGIALTTEQIIQHGPEILEAGKKVVEGGKICVDAMIENPVLTSIGVSAALQAKKLRNGFKTVKNDKEAWQKNFHTGQKTHEHRIANMEKFMNQFKNTQEKMMMMQLHSLKDGDAWNVRDFTHIGICEMCSKCKKNNATHGKEDAESPEMCLECVKKTHKEELYSKDFTKDTIHNVFNNVAQWSEENTQLQILNPETQVTVPLSAASIVADLANATSNLSVTVKEQQCDLKEQRKMQNLMMQRLIENGSSTNRLIGSIENQNKRMMETNSILVSQNKNIQNQTNTISTLVTMNKEAQEKITKVEKKADDAQKAADDAEEKAIAAEEKAKDAEKKAKKWKTECETAINDLNELSIIKDTEEFIGTQLETKITSEPERFRGQKGTKGAQGVQGVTGARGARGAQGARGNRGAGFWEDTGRAVSSMF